MKRKRPTMTVAVLSLFLIFAVLAGAQQAATKCPCNDIDPKAPEYRIGLASHSAKKGCELYLFISVDATHFVREDMVALAHQLNRDFCYEKRVSAIILDDYAAARSPFRNIKFYLEAERGIYKLNRESGEQYIKFSTARDKPKDEVVIDLSTSSKTNTNPHP